jgi:hypothetical protein
MVTARVLAPFKCFQFFAAFGSPQASDALLRLGQPLDGSTALLAVWSNPFEPEIWLGAAHTEERETIHTLAMRELERARERFDEGVQRDPHGRFAAWMTQGSRQSVKRRIDARFTTVRWIPLDLNASRSDPALEWLVLEGVEYLGMQDDEPRG